VSVADTFWLTGFWCGTSLGFLDQFLRVFFVQHAAAPQIGRRIQDAHVVETFVSHSPNLQSQCAEIKCLIPSMRATARSTKC